MKNKVLSFAVAFAVLLGVATIAQAEFSYDFRTLSDGDLLDQDNWRGLYSWGSLSVVSGTGATNFTGGDCGGLKDMSLGEYSSDTILLGTAQFYNITASDALAGFVDTSVNEDNWLPIFGISTGTAYFRDAVDYTEHYGDALTLGNTYDMQLTVDLSTAGGLATVSYRDVTAGDTDFTTDSSLVNIPMGLTQNGEGKYEFGALALRIAGYGSGISEFNLTTVPEPSTLAIILSGVFGLLAYAWRKRK